MRKLLLFVVLLPLINIYSQNVIIQRGCVKVVNFKTKSNNVLPDVIIEAKKANQVESGSDGKFVLNFVNINNEDTIDFTRIYRYGYELQEKGYFQKHKWTISSFNELEIVMVSKAERDAYEDFCKENLTKTIVNKFKKDTIELRKQLKSKDISLAQFEIKINKFQDDYNNSWGVIDRLVEEYSQFDFEKQDSIDKKFTEYITLGDVENARKVLDLKGNVSQLLKEYKNSKAVLEIKKTEIVKADSAQNQKKEILLNLLKKNADIAKLDFSLDTVSYFLKQCVELDSSNFENVLALFSFFADRNNIDGALALSNTILNASKENWQKSISLNMLGLLYTLAFQFEKADYYLSESSKFNKINDYNDTAYYFLGAMSQSFKVIKLCITEQTSNVDINSLIKQINTLRNIAKENKNIRPVLGYSLMVLAIVQSDERQYNKAEKNLLESLSILKIDSIKNTSMIIANINYLALIETKKKQFEKAQTYYNDVIKLARNCYSQDSDKYKPYLVMVLVGYASLQYTHRYYASAELYYTEAIKLNRDLAKSSILYKSILSLNLNSLSNLQKDSKQYKKAEINISEALKISRELINYSIQHQSLLASNLNDLANIQCELRQYSKADSNYNEALIIRRELAKENSEQYISGVSETLNNWANLQKLVKQYDKAEINYTESLKIRKLLASKDSIYYIDVANTLRNIALLQEDVEQFEKAETNYNEALKVWTQLSKKTDSYDSDIALLYNDIAELQMATKQFKKAEINLTKALEIRKRLALSDSIFYLDLAKTFNDLANVQYNMNQYDMALISIKEALLILKKLDNPHFQQYYSDIAFIKGTSSHTLYNIKQYEKAEINYIETLGMYKNLAGTNPKEYNYYLAGVLHDLARLEIDLNQYNKSEIYYVEAISIKRELLKINILEYGLDFVETLNDFATSLCSIEQFDKAETFCIEALSILNIHQEKKNQKDFNAHLAYTMGQLAYIESHLKQINKAEVNYLKAVGIYKELIKIDKTYNSEIANLFRDFANMQQSAEQYDKAEVNFIEALNIYKQLAIENPEEYQREVAITLDCLASIMQIFKQYDKAEVYSMEALNIYKKMAKRNIEYSIDLSKSYGNIAYYQLLMRKFQQAENTALKGLEVDSNQLWIKTNLADALLFQGKYEEAKKIYIELKDREYPEDKTKTFKYYFLQDLDELEKAGITHPDVAKVRTLLN